MPRTTVDIDGVVLRALRRRQREEGTTMSSLVSQLLAHALDQPPVTRSALEWNVADMAARVDIDDHEAVRRAMGE